MSIEDIMVEPEFYFNDKPLLVVKSPDIKETTSFLLEEEPNSDKPSMDFLKPFSFSCEATMRKKDTRKLIKMFKGKKHRLPRKLKKAMRGIATYTPLGEWHISITAVCNLKVRNKWQRKADDVLRMKIDEYWELKHPCVVLS